jgi:hypothetical protein
MSAPVVYSPRYDITAGDDLELLKDQLDIIKRIPYIRRVVITCDPGWERRAYDYVAANLRADVPFINLVVQHPDKSIAIPDEDVWADLRPFNELLPSRMEWDIPINPPPLLQWGSQMQFYPYRPSLLHALSLDPQPEPFPDHNFEDPVPEPVSFISKEILSAIIEHNLQTVNVKSDYWDFNQIGAFVCRATNLKKIRFTLTGFRGTPHPGSIYRIYPRPHCSNRPNHAVTLELVDETLDASNVPGRCFADVCVNNLIDCVGQNSIITAVNLSGMRGLLFNTSADRIFGMYGAHIHTYVAPSCFLIGKVPLSDTITCFETSMCNGIPNAEVLSSLQRNLRILRLQYSGIYPLKLNKLCEQALLNPDLEDLVITIHKNVGTEVLDIMRLISEKKPPSLIRVSFIGDDLLPRMSKSSSEYDFYRFAAGPHFSEVVRLIGSTGIEEFVLGGPGTSGNEVSEVNRIDEVTTMLACSRTLRKFVWHLQVRYMMSVHHHKISRRILDIFKNSASLNTLSIGTHPYILSLIHI